MVFLRVLGACDSLFSSGVSGERNIIYLLLHSLGKTPLKLLS